MPLLSLRRSLPLAAALALVASAPASAQPNAFSAPQPLPRTLPSKDQYQGGEPSVSFDPAGDGHVYAVAPGSDGSNGVGFWRSDDHGLTWHDAQAIGSGGGGGDSDVGGGNDHPGYGADPELIAHAICRSPHLRGTLDNRRATRTARKPPGPASARG